MDKVDWALFEKDAVQKLVKQYGEWTGKLYRIIGLACLVKGTLGRYIQMVGEEQGMRRALPVMGMVGRQIRAETEFPEDFNA